MICDAHNVEPEAAVLEKLPDCGAKAGPRPGAAEAALEVAHTCDKNRSIEGTTKRTANKSCRGLWRHIDGLIHRCDFGDRNATINCI
jgi:hypothetical protein